MKNYLANLLPQLLRNNRTLFMFSCQVFIAAMIVSFLIELLFPDTVYLVYGEYQLAEFTRAYNPEIFLPVDNLVESTWANGAFYLLNNCLVGLQLTVAGLLVGLGPLVLLLFNAVSLGLLMGHLYSNGFGVVLWPGVITHSSVEILATVLSATAGFRLGIGVLQAIRSTSLAVQIASLKTVIHLLSLALVLYSASAFLEAGWSHNPLIWSSAKYVVGLLLWSLIIGYCYKVLKQPAE